MTVNTANKKIKDTDYLFLSAYIRAKEVKMLTLAQCERMLDAAGFAECAKLLEECGYEDMSGMGAAEIERTLTRHRDAVFAELAQLSPNQALVDIFRCKYDYHNAKVLIKAEGANVDGAHLLSGSGRVAGAALAEAYHAEDYVSLPSQLGAAIADARGILARTGNPQLADFALDKAYFAELRGLAAEAQSPFLTGYVRILIDSANLRAAVRILRMGRDHDFLRQALIPDGGYGVESILQSAATGEALSALFSTSSLKAAAEIGAAAVSGGSLTEFEKACDNAVAVYLGSARLKSFGDAPVIAYIAAVESEIAAARMILTGRLSGVPSEQIKERLREINA